MSSRTSRTADLPFHLKFLVSYGKISCWVHKGKILKISAIFLVSLLALIGSLGPAEYPLASQILVRYSCYEMCCTQQKICSCTNCFLCKCQHLGALSPNRLWVHSMMTRTKLYSLFLSIWSQAFGQTLFSRWVDFFCHELLN